MGWRSAGSASRPRSRTPAAWSTWTPSRGSSTRLETLVFGPADFMASINMRTLVVGEQPPGYTEGDAYHYILMRILMAARTHDLQAIDGPYLAIKDLDGYRRVAGRAAALGFDGKWVLHPSQVEAANEVFSPSQEDYDHAELILDAYDYYTTVEKRGAVMLGDEMIDEASRKMALVVAAKGRAAGLGRTGIHTAYRLDPDRGEEPERRGQPEPGQRGERQPAEHREGSSRAVPAWAAPASSR